MSNQNLDELLGPAGKGDYKPGDTITFTESDQTLTGEVIHVEAAGTTPVSKTPHPLTYWVDCGDGFPHVVYSSQLVEKF